MFQINLKSPKIDSNGNILEKSSSIKNNAEHRKVESASNGNSNKMTKEVEIINTMQSHFTRNHLQQITLLLEMLQGEVSQDQRELVNKALNICNQSVDTIIKVDKIYSLLQKKSLEIPKMKVSLLELISKVSLSLNLPVNVDKNSLDYTLLVDDYFFDCIHEILSFLSSAYGKRLFIYGKEVLDKNSFLVISICEDTSNPLSFDICEQILNDIDDNKWISTKKYLGLVLSCLIAKKYGGKLVIIPHSGRGNTFNLSLPFSSII